MAVEVSEVEGRELLQGGGPVISAQSKVLSPARHSLNQNHLATPLNTTAGQMLATTLLLACQHACVPEVVPCVTQHTLVLQPLAAVGSDTGSAAPNALGILGIVFPLRMLLHGIGPSNLQICTLIYMYYVRGRST